MPDIRKDNLLFLTVQQPLQGAIGQALPLSKAEIGDGELWKEDMEAEAEVGGEEMASALFASPLLTLSESSCSPKSNLSNISHVNIETLESMMEESPKTEQHNSRFNECDEHENSTTNAPAKLNRNEGQVNSTDKLPGLLTFTNGTKNPEHPGGEEKLNKEKGGEGHSNKESGGGEGGDANDKGEREGNGDGGKERQGNEEKDGNDDKDGDAEREEEEDDFDELTQDEDEEEVMSSASEESVLSVPELQVCTASFS